MAHKNMINLIKKLFPVLFSNNYDQIMIPDDCLSYVTPSKWAKKTCDIIKNLFDKYFLVMGHVMDCTACVGGDSLHLSEHFDLVTSIEIDREVYQNLVHNIGLYQKNNIVTINDSFLNVICKEIDCQAIYIDPPWGGKNYKNYRKLTLSIDDISIEKITIDILTKKYKIRPTFIIWKLPYNYDLDYFENEINKACYYTIIEKHIIKKMIIVTITNKNAI